MGGETHRVETRLKEGDTAMEQKITTQGSASSPMWDRLEAFVREPIQRFI